MKNLSFVLWMLGYPLLGIIDDHLSFLQGFSYSDDVELLSAIINILIWLYVGTLLYVPKEKPETKSVAPDA